MKKIFSSLILFGYKIERGYLYLNITFVSKIAKHYTILWLCFMGLDIT